MMKLNMIREGRSETGRCSKFIFSIKLVERGHAGDYWGGPRSHALGEHTTEATVCYASLG